MRARMTLPPAVAARFGLGRARVGFAPGARPDAGRGLAGGPGGFVDPADVTIGDAAGVRYFADGVAVGLYRTLFGQRIVQVFPSGAVEMRPPAGDEPVAFAQSAAQWVLAQSARRHVLVPIHMAYNVPEAHLGWAVDRPNAEAHRGFAVLVSPGGGAALHAAATDEETGG